MSDADYRLELSTKPKPAVNALRPPRPWLSVMFACCSVYQRVYQTPDGSYYRGRCPKCSKTVSFKVGTGGTSVRQFIAT